MIDIYQRDINFLTENPHLISNAWQCPGSLGGSLFQFCQKEIPNFDSTGRTLGLSVEENIGCLTQVRGGYRRAETVNLTERIFADKRIPEGRFDIKVEHLILLREWQLILDKELGRKTIMVEDDDYSTTFYSLQVEEPV